MTSTTLNLPVLQDLDGFRIEVDADRERGDIILDRAPMNVISMAERDQLRLAFEALDSDDSVRVIVLRAEGVSAPTRARYLWSDAAQGSLLNGVGIPIAPFESR